ncbi:N-acetylglucosamine-6-phosphate deacetylase [Palleronia aestuarii]|uniref:N-acetylglucosamine-6-phosphate deacetylase n=1 Tax=Palleronia aestuarii TaxID=568105 RepID=A0A2W7PQL8_9RHOB|nr:N-acetylglucosamine-6-phosphate deacetylase [Palleronia aestuarii]PZX11719.1 N-acetylglucosamine-6-phosphate deacetylase [Palleronia aestuarii]
MRIAPKYLWSGGCLRENCSLIVEGCRITDIAEAEGTTADLHPHLVMPSLTDLQVNGGGGIMVNDRTGSDGLRAIAEAHGRLGTGWILPTVITDAPETLAAAARAVIEIYRPEDSVLGLHIEGPHISPERRGTHDPRYIRPLEIATVEIVEDLRRRGIPVMITLAPERCDTALLGRLVASGAIVSAGHSAATAEEAEAAFVRGVTCVTHLFNAMDPMMSRAPGLLGAAIAAPVHAGIIADGIHVDRRMLSLAIRGRPRPGLTFAVSDAMATVGGPSSFHLYGREISVRDNRLVNSEGALAGAHVDLATCFANLVLMVGLELAEACAMVTDTPRRVLGLPSQHLGRGWPTDRILMFDADLRRIAIPAEA